MKKMRAPPAYFIRLVQSEGRIFVQVPGSHSLEIKNQDDENLGNWYFGKGDNAARLKLVIIRRVPHAS